MPDTKAYPDNFKYKESHWEGTHTSYSWHPSIYDGKVLAKIVGETRVFYLVSGYWGTKKMKKENIQFVE